MQPVEEWEQSDDPRVAASFAGANVLAFAASEQFGLQDLLGPDARPGAALPGRRASSSGSAANPGHPSRSPSARCRSGSCSGSPCSSPRRGLNENVTGCSAFGSSTSAALNGRPARERNPVSSPCPALDTSTRTISSVICRPAMDFQTTNPQPGSSRDSRSSSRSPCGSRSTFPDRSADTRCRHRAAGNGFAPRAAPARARPGHG